MFLEKIKALKREKLEAKKRDKSYISFLKERLTEVSPIKREFKCPKDRNCIIAEIKQASPSEGMIKEVNPVAMAQIYEKAQASAISVLTEEIFFKGSLDFLARVSKKVHIPVLRKDFILDEIEILEAKVFGADLILLIASLLTESQLRDFVETSLELGLTPLIEIFEEKEINKVLKYYDYLIGVNNRNLQTLEVNIGHSEKIIPLLKESGVKIAVAESGIKNCEDIKRLKKAQADAFLIGTSLMKSSNPYEKLKKLVNCSEK